uniref:uncharacterized protein n=1 Tax=Myxine glutinosa TaxID=7769 RepID=UPI00358DFE76
MAQLTTEQRTFLVTTFHQTGSLQRTRDALRERFPEREPPVAKTIWANVRKYQEHGTSLNRNKGNSGRRCTGRSEMNIAAVRQQVLEHPRDTSARRNGTGLPSATFNRITRLDLHQHPYRIHIWHQLTPGDFARRLVLAGWLIARCEADVNFLQYLVIGNEAAFTMDSKVNTHNVLEYAPTGQLPEFNFDTNMNRQKWTVCLGLCGSGQVIGPFFFQRNVNGNRYLQMINDEVLPQLEENFEQQFRGVFRYRWWAQDGAPAHRLIALRDRLRELFGDRVIALNHAVEWPPRSPDLTPCDYFLWGHLKNKVFVTPLRDLDELQGCIRHEVDAFRNDPALVRRAVQGMLRRCELCVERGGGHVEGVGA